MRRPSQRLTGSHVTGGGARGATAANTGTASSPPLATTAPSLPRGTRLADRYCVVGLLGRGGMGEVYEALDLALGIRVALKTLHTAIAHDPSALRRFKREVLMARSITHTSVCRIYDLGWAEDRGREVLFLTMELLRGEPLAERLAKRGRLSPDEALPLVRQMSAALDAAHSAGVVHRDFKCGNVMLVPGPEGERAVVTDFGLALPVAAEGAAGVLTGDAVGTPSYMAPEQVRGQRAGPAADIYALGVVLFEMMTGRRPFRGASPLATATMRLEHDPPPPRSLVPDLDPRWEGTILRCLHREPERRFARAAEVISALLGEGTQVIRHELPAERDVFVGREPELAELDRQLEGGARLVTLLGPAGAGKTRLSARYGQSSSARFPGGVWLCDLTQAQSPVGIASAVATALGVPLGSGEPIEKMGQILASRGRCLVILDNFEPVVEHAPATAGRWLERAEEARFLVTSRERLRLGGEVLLSLGPLDQEAGVRLFVERAAASRPGFVLDPGNQETVRRLVGLLEGLPLAIELAAARTSVMSPAQVLERLKDRFRLLARGEATGRHASLRAAIDGSWELLAPSEKAAFAQASVFEGGFTLEAAEAVLDLTACPEAGAEGGVWTVDVVQALVDKSLFRTWVPEGAYGEPRFGMYASLQEYARGKLAEGRGERGGIGATLRAEQRHGAYYGGFGAEEARAALHRHGGVRRTRELARELENLVVACRRAAASGKAETAALAYGAAWEVLDLHGPYAVSVELGSTVLEVAGLPPAACGRALWDLGQACSKAGRMEQARARFEDALACASESGDRRFAGIALASLGSLHLEHGRMEEARRNLEQALAIHRETGNHRFEGSALGSLGTWCKNQGRMEEARAHYEQALAIHREIGDHRLEGNMLSSLGNLHLDQGRLEEARTHYGQALDRYREVGDRRAEGAVLGNLGIVHSERGSLEEARAHYERALASHREVGDRCGEGRVLGNLGILHSEQGRIEEARTSYEETLAICREVGDPRFEGAVLINLGDLFLEQDRLEEARVYFEQALAIHRGIGSRRYEGVVLGSLGRLHAREGRLEQARAAFDPGERLLREVDDRVELGKLLCRRGQAAVAGRDRERARAALNEATSLAAATASGPESALGRELRALREKLADGASLDDRCVASS